MKYGLGGKVYLSAILDLVDKSIVSFEIGHSNNNDLVFKTFDTAHEKYPNAKPLFHSDCCYQYTSKKFKEKLVYHQQHIFHFLNVLVLHLKIFGMISH